MAMHDITTGVALPTQEAGTIINYTVQRANYMLRLPMSYENSGTSPPEPLHWRSSTFVCFFFHELGGFASSKSWPDGYGLLTHENCFVKGSIRDELLQYKEL